MAHYAFLNDNFKVTEVIVGKNEGDTDWESYYENIKNQSCKRTSYNTRGGIHIKGGTPFRKNYAGVGYTYDDDKDAFISPKPFNSWVLDDDSCNWIAPVTYPTDGQEYRWDEENTIWVLEN